MKINDLLHIMCDLKRKGHFVVIEFHRFFAAIEARFIVT